MFRVVILGSGRGSNAEAVLRVQDSGGLGVAQIVGLFSDVPDAGILKLGPRYELPAFYLKPGKFKTKLTGQSETHYIESIAQLNPDLIVLAGFMRVIKAPFLKAFDGKVINLHPSLLPKFPGLHAIKQAFDAGEKQTGCTVHWVNEVIDGGKIIDQAKVDIDKSDTLESIEAKVHEAEHVLLPKVIAGLGSAALEIRRANR